MKKLYGILVLFLFLSIALFLARSNFLNINQSDINLLDASCLSKTDVASLIDQQNHKIFLLKSDQLIKNIKDKYDCVDSVSINKKYPNKLEVEVTGKKAALVLNDLVTNYDGMVINLSDQDLEATPSSQSALTSPNLDDIAKQSTQSGIFQVSKSGEVFSSVSPSRNVPTFTYIGEKLMIGQQLDVNTLANALNTIGKIEKLGLQINGEPLLYNNYLEVKSSNPNTVFIALDKDIDREVASLQLILETGKMNSGSKSMESVDLRFNKPVVVYNNK